MKNRVQHRGLGWRGQALAILTGVSFGELCRSSIHYAGGATPAPPPTMDKDVVWRRIVAGCARCNFFSERLWTSRSPHTYKQVKKQVLKSLQAEAEAHGCTHLADYTRLAQQQYHAQVRALGLQQRNAAKGTPMERQSPSDELAELREKVKEDGSAYRKKMARFTVAYHLYQQVLAGENTPTNNSFSDISREIAAYRKNKEFKTDWENVPEKMTLIVGELCGEAMENYRHFTPTTIGHLTAASLTCKPDAMAEQALLDVLGEDQYAIYEAFVEEMADTVIRLLDLTASLGIPISDAIAKKMALNELRPAKHGKQC